MSRRTSCQNTAKRTNYSAKPPNYSAKQSNYSAKKPRRVVRLPKVKRKTGWSKATIYAKIAEGLFPAPAHLLDGKAAIWDEGEIDDLIEAAFAARDEAVAQ
jgi:prophage regulatory protein